MPAPEKNAPPTRKKNRDQESLYKPGQLSRWFAVTSVILALGWVAMIWKDYARPWKTYQKDFYAKMIEIEEARSKEVKQQLDPEEIQPLEKAVTDAKALVARAETADRIAELRAQVEQYGKDMAQSDRKFKSTKGMHAVAKYQFEMALLEVETLTRKQKGEKSDKDREIKDYQDDIDAANALAEEKRTWLNQLSEEWWARKREFETLNVKWQTAKDQIAELLAPVRQAEKELARAKAVATKQIDKSNAIAQRFGKNAWRNAPFIDFISPTIKIKQVVLHDIHDNWNFATSPKVDRCMTCHVGINIPDFANPETIEQFKVDPYMQGHPHIEVIAGPNSPHKMDKFGCSACHHGVGWAVDFARASHQTIDEEKRRGWEKAHGWYKAKYIDYPMIPLEYVQGQCIKCHKAGMFEPVHYDESLDHGYIEDDEKRGILAQRTITNDPSDPAFNSPENVPLSPGKAYGVYRLPKAPLPVSGSQEQVAQATRAWLREHQNQKGAEHYHDDRVPTRGWRPDQYWKGYDSIVTYGCQGCHKISDFGDQVGYEAPPKVGPELTYLMDKIKPEWLPLWIKHPDAYRVDTKMPSFFWYMRKDSSWEYLKDAEGKRLAPIMVIDAHMTHDEDDLDKNFREVVGRLSRPEDLAFANLSILAMTEYLKNQVDPRTGKPYTRKDPSSPSFDPTYAEDVSGGDPLKGRLDINTLGCTACHVVPEIEQADGSFAPDGPERFDYDPLLMRGPRITSMGSKVTAEWLNAWLKEPRHYTSTTRMPNMRIDDQTALEDGKTVVVRSAQERRADIIAYLLQYKDEEFEKLEAPVYKQQYDKLLEDMYEEYFGKTPDGKLKDPDVASAEVGDLSNPDRLATVLAMVGERLLSRNGCFGCHNAAGHELEQPIGTELTKEGIKDIHQLDFGRVPKYVKVERRLKTLDDDGKPIVNDKGEFVYDEDTTKVKLDVLPHQRHNFFRTKITYPRIYDYSKRLRWTDKLRMPRFNFREDDGLQLPRPDVPLAAFDPDNPAHLSDQSTRRAVTGIILGLVKEPIKPGAMFTPDAYQQDIIDGRRVIKRYGCNNCHTIEGKTGLLWGTLSEQGKEAGVLPPNLFTQGWRVRDEWLAGFLQDPVYLRPLVQIHMPNFRLSDAETNALVRYFKRLAGRDRNLGAYNPRSRLIDGELSKGGYGEKGLTVPCEKDGHQIGPMFDAVDEAKRLFNEINCNKCHLPKGAPGADPADGGVAPSFSHARERLRHQWVRMLLYNPQHLIDGTKMPSIWPDKGRKFGLACPTGQQAYQFHLRNDAQWVADFRSDDPTRRNLALTRLAEVQMDALTDYVIHHYEAPTEQPPGAPAGGK